ncbi:MAG: V-type ATP synthase subunit F [Gaiella sp.]|nr:V-type ATP synthase subunit F [Gaiella sp.]
MSRIVAIGDGPALSGYALAGVDVVDAPTPEQVRRAWADALGGASLVLLTAEARAALPDRLERSVPWTVVPA